MARRTNHDLIYNLAENSSGDEDEQVSVDEDPQPEQTVPTAYASAPAALPDTSPAGDDSPPNDVGFINKHTTSRQKMKWTPANDRKLLLFGFRRAIKASEQQTIADSYEVEATGQSIAVHLGKLRKERDDALEKAQIYKDGATFARPSEPTEAAKDQQVMTRMNWDVRADRSLLLFGMGRERIHRGEYGRMAGNLPNRPTRQAIGQRIEELYQESRQTLASHGLGYLEVAAQAPRRPSREDGADGTSAG